MAKIINVLVVDDSAFMRKAITKMLEEEGDIKVVGTAKDGAEAVELAASLKPDILTLDVEMPVMNGLEALEKIMKESPVPVLMLSSITEEGAESTLKAMDLGAVDFIAKPASFASMNMIRIKDVLIAKVKTISGISAGKIKSRVGTEPEDGESRAELKGGVEEVTNNLQAKEVDIVAIGTSTGGPPALQAILPTLPKDFPVGILIVQHMPPGFTRSLAERLNDRTKIEVKEAQEGDIVRAGRALIAPAGVHLTLERKPGAVTVIALNENPADTLHKPSVDIMMSSVAMVYGERSMGVILTGMGSDGAKGIGEIKAKGGKTIAEAEETCVVFGMPRVAIEAGSIDNVLPLNEVVPGIIREL